MTYSSEEEVVDAIQALEAALEPTLEDAARYAAAGGESAATLVILTVLQFAARVTVRACGTEHLFLLLARRVYRQVASDVTRADP